MPQGTRLVESGFLQVAVEADVVPDAVLLGHVLEVPAHLVLPGEVLGPRIVLLEVVLVGGARGVDAGVGVLVDAPYAADLVAALEDDIGDAETLELGAGGDAAEPAADDGHEEAFRQLRLPVGPLGVPRDLVERRQVAPGQELLVGHDDAGRHLHQVPQLLLRRPRQRHVPRVVLEELDRLRDQGLALLGTELRHRPELLELGIASGLEQGDLHCSQVGHLDGSTDERFVNFCTHWWSYPPIVSTPAAEHGRTPWPTNPRSTYHFLSTECFSRRADPGSTAAGARSATVGCKQLRDRHTRRSSS